MELEWDEAKRVWTLDERRLDFAHADKVFAGRTLTIEDDRQEYGEVRFQTYGRLRKSIVMVVWTPRGEARRIISMRKCNGDERKKVEHHLGGSG